VNVRRAEGRLGAVIVSSRSSARRLAQLQGVAWVEPLRARRLAFTASDPLASRQWYLEEIRAFQFWNALPPLPPVRVAVIDSGVDLGHPDLNGRIALARSFVDGRPTDRHGHGTFVAGILAAGVNNGHGIAGVGVNVELLVAKVVKADGTVPIDAEAAAIRWAADAGARVINLSLGGLRDPLNPERDTYSELEASAVRYAQSRGALVVAAVGNSTEAPRRPWPYANYPAALPKVLGVSALERGGSVPTFSSRDRIHNDLAAPGQDMFSTLPRTLTAQRPGCANQGYADCGPEQYHRARGTSFAAPQVSAAAALVFGAFPTLTASQVATLLTRAADDAAPGTGCATCEPGRDAVSGWGRLDVTSALRRARWSRIPPADLYEPNDDAGSSAWTLWGRSGRTVTATADYWDDQSDVYRVHLRAGQRLDASVRGPRGLTIVLWRPGTERVDALAALSSRLPAAQARQIGASRRLRYRPPAREGGWFFLQVKLTEPGAGRYRLTFSKR
jgi:subtilisin family serine protease